MITETDINSSKRIVQANTVTKFASASRRAPVWKYDVEHQVYDNACKAMETRPDYPQIERLWSALDERFTFMKHEYDPGDYAQGTDGDDDLLHEIDLSVLADEAGIDEEETLSHLRTLQGAGCILALSCYQEYKSVSVLIAPHMGRRA